MARNRYTELEVKWNIIKTFNVSVLLTNGTSERPHFDTMELGNRFFS
jgi:hypothetical protein